MNELPFDQPLTREQAAYELQRPVQAVSPLAEALDRVGVSKAVKDELMGQTGLSAALVDRVWVKVKLADGDVGMLVYRLRLAAAAMEQAAEDPPLPAGEKRRKWEQEAAAQTEARIREEQHAEQNRATLRKQLEMFSDQERARCVGVVLARSPWLRRVCRSEDPLKSRLLGALVVTEWCRGGSREGDFDGG